MLCWISGLLNRLSIGIRGDECYASSFIYGLISFCYFEIGNCWSFLCKNYCSALLKLSAYLLLPLLKLLLFTAVAREFSLLGTTGYLNNAVTELDILIVKIGLQWWIVVCCFCYVPTRLTSWNWASQFELVLHLFRLQLLYNMHVIFHFPFLAIYFLNSEPASLSSIKLVAIIL